MFATNKLSNKNNKTLDDISSCKLFNEWLKILKISTAKNTFLSYQRDVSNFIKFFINTDDQIKSIEHLIEAISIGQIRKWLVFLQQKKLCARSRSRMISAVKNFFEYCFSQGIIKHNVLQSITMPKTTPALPKSIEHEEIEALISHLQKTNSTSWIDKRNVLMLLIMYVSGLRITEVVELKLCNIDFANKTIRISCGKGAKERIVPTLDLVLEKAAEYIGLCPYISNQNSYLFWGQKGRVVQRTYFANLIQTARKQLGLPEHITPHAFRHSCATHLLNRGTSIKIVQTLLGHTSLNSTQIYTQVDYTFKIKEYQKRHPLAQQNKAKS